MHVRSAELARARPSPAAPERCRRPTSPPGPARRPNCPQRRSLRRAGTALAFILFAPPALAQVSSQFSVTNITNTTASVTLSGHSGAWYLGVAKQDGTAVSCTAQSGNTSANLADLTASTTYDITAWTESFSSCAGGVVGTIAFGSFTTLATPVVNLAASNVTHNSATLTITNHSDAWYYKYTVPSTPADTCSSVVAAGTSTASLSNLTSATSYTYKAYSDTSCSTELTSAANDADFVTKPGQVTGVAATAAPEALTVSWTALTGTVTGYKVQWKKGNENYSSARTRTVTGGTKTSAEIGPLTANVEYTVRVMAYNASGDGAPSSEATGTPTPEVEFSVTNVGFNSATVTLSGYSGAWYLRLNNGGNVICTLQSGSTPVGLTNLDANTNYTITAYKSPPASGCSGGASVIAQENFKTARQPVLQASSVTHSSATLTMVNYGDDWYYKYTTPKTPAAACSTVVSAGTNTASVASLVSGTTYTFKAYSDSQCTAELTSASTDAEFLTKPGQVTGVTVTAGNARLEVSWVAVSGTVTGYKVQWKKGNESYDSTRQNTVTGGASSTILGVANGTAYTVRVTAYNGGGDGAASSDVAGTPVGGAVTLTASSVEDASATLTIANHTGPWHYKYTAPSTPAGTCSTKVSTGTSTASLSTLSRGTNYTFNAYSDSQCTSELTSASTDAHFLTKPGRVTGVTATAGDTSLSVNWTAVSGTLTGYRVQWKKGNESYDSTRTNTVASGTTTNSITGLTNNTTYTVRVVAYNATGDGAASSELTATPAAPSVTLTASSVEATTATLTIANHTLDWFYKYTAPTTPPGTCSGVIRTGTFTANLASLIAGTNYTFKAYSDISCNTELTSAATDADFLTKPGQVTGLSAAGAKEALAVSWTVATSATGYTVQWKDIDQQYDSSRQATPTSNSHKITGLTDRGAYTIRVRASNGTGVGIWSADATGSPSPSVVPYPTFSLSGGSRQLTATWSHPLPSATGLTFRLRYRKAGTSGWIYVDASSNSGHQNFPDTATSTTIPGHEGGTLDDNANYEVEIRAGKWNQGFSGWGPWSGTKTMPTLPGAPTKPTVTVANLGGGKVQVASMVTGAAKLTGWEYKQEASDGSDDTDWTEVSSTSSSLSHTVTGLTNGKDYRFLVRAVNAAGSGAESPRSDRATPQGASLTASAVTHDSATLTIGNHTGNWYYKRTTPPGGQCSTTVSGTTASLTGLSTGTAHTFKAYSDSRCTAELATESFTTKPAQVTGLRLSASSATLEASWNAVTGATGYTVQWKTSSQQYDSSRQATPTGSSYTIANLTDGRQYTVRVRATGSGGDGAWSSEATGTPAVLQPVLTATNITTAGATFSLSNRTGTWYLKGGASAGVSSAAVANCVAVSGGSLSSYTLTNLKEYTTYTFAAYSAADCAEASKLKSLTFRTASRLGKVTGLTATAGSDSSIDVNWTAVGGVSQYKLQWKSGAQDWSSTRQAIVNANSHTIPKNSVDANTAYTFRVAATDSQGDGPWSDEVVATPVEVTLAASNVGADSATLTIANLTGTWYYKQTAPTAGTCSSGVATASTAVSGLSPGQTHTFNAYSDNQCTGTVLATTPQFLTKPGKVAGVAATAASAALDVSWTATTGVSSYKVQWKSGSDDWDATNRQTTSTTASTTVPSLTNGIQYTVRVAAVNDAGDGAWSDTATGMPSGSSLGYASASNGGVFILAGHTGTWYSKVTPPADATCETNSIPQKIVADKSAASSYTITAYSDANCATQLTSLDFTTQPGKVAGVTATARAASLGVSWTAATGTAPVSYKVQWKSGTEDWDATNRQVVTTKTSTALTGLTNGTQYTIRVAATTASGDGSWSDNATGTPSATAVTLSVSGLSATGGTFALANHTGDWWYKVVPPAASNCNKGVGYTVSESTLSAGTEYTVTAYSNSSCTTELTSLDVLTLPGKTAGVTLANTGASLGVSWTAVIGATSYKLQWKSSADSGWDAANRQTTSTTTSATIPSLTNDTAYTVRVAAVNASGDGAWSDTVTETPTITLTVRDVTSTGAKLTVAGHTGTVYLSGRGGNSYSLACTAASGGTYSPTLQGNTTYEFKAYRTSGCTGTELAATSFTTPGAITMVADNVTDTSAEMWLIGYKTLPPGTYSYHVRWAQSLNDRGISCYRLNRLSNGGVSVDGLRASTNYVGEFFRGGDCAAINRFASAPFTTLAANAPLPKLSITNVTDTGATLSLTNHAGTWWHSDDFADPKVCNTVAGGATEAHVTGLTANKTYHFTAWSDSKCGADKTSVWKSHATFTTTGPLTIGVADKTSTSLQVNLRGYTEANGYPDWWSVNIGPSNGNSCQTLQRSTTSATFSGLTAGTQYTIRVFKNSYCAPITNMINKTQTTTVSLVGGSVGPSSASLTLEHHEGAWSYRGGEASGQAAGQSVAAQASGQGSGAAGAVGQASGGGQDNSGGGAGTQSADADAATNQCRAMSAGQTTANLTGLKAETSYTYTAYDGSDCSGLELAQAAFDTASPAVPAAPAGLSAAAGDASVTLTWSDPSDSSITGYEYQVNHNDTDTGKLTGWGSWTAIEGSGADTTSHAVEGLANGREYRFRMRAQNDAGTSANAPEADPWYVSATPQAPAKPVAPETPSSVSVTRADGTLNVSWPAVEGATSYHITYSSDNGASWSLAALNHPDNRIEITGVDNALTCIVGVRARNKHGDGGWRNSPPTAPYTGNDGGAGIALAGELADLAPDFGAARIPDLLLEANLVMEPLVLPEATGGDGELTYGLSPELPAGLSFDPATRVLSGLPTQPAVARTFEYTVTDSDVIEPDVAVLTFRIAVEVSAVDRAVLNEALAAQGRAFLTSATSAIGERFRAPAGAPAADCPEERGSDAAGSECDTAPGRVAAAFNAFASLLASQAGGPSPAGGAWNDGYPAGTDDGAGFGRMGTFGPAGALGAAGSAGPNLHTAGQPEWGLGEVLRMLPGRSFTMPLYAADDRDGGDAATRRHWTLWGAADLQTFDNPAEAGRYDGGVTSMFLGVDGRFGGGDWLGGAALSASRGETDYAAQGREGRLETELAGFHPYLRTETAWGLEWWALGGVGAGEAKDLPGAAAGPADQAAPIGATVDTADLEMRMAATGLRLPLRQRGAVELALVGGLGTLTLSTDDKDRGLRALSGLEADVSQGRLGIEVSRTGQGLLPWLRLGARRDGGDGVTGTGLETVAGVRYGGARVDFEAQLRWLGAYSNDEYEDYEEYGGMARLMVKAREDGSGLRLTLAPAWGQAGMGGALLGGEGLFGGPGLGAMPMAGGMAGGSGHGALSLESELGYGFALGRSLLTLGGTHRRNGPTVTETVGLTWELGGSDSESGADQGPDLRLGYELPAPAFEGGPYLELKYTHRF